MLQPVNNLTTSLRSCPAVSAPNAVRDGFKPAGLKRPSPGGNSWRKIAPDLFSEWVRCYSDLLDRAVNRRICCDGASLSAELCDLSTRLGRIQAGARDVIEMHTRVLDDKLASVRPGLKTAYREEGRFLVLELMGRLLSYYRTALHQTTQPTGQGRGPSSALWGEPRD